MRPIVDFLSHARSSQGASEARAGYAQRLDRGHQSDHSALATSKRSSDIYYVLVGNGALAGIDCSGYERHKIACRGVSNTHGGITAQRYWSKIYRGMSRATTTKMMTSRQSKREGQSARDGEIYTKSVHDQEVGIQRRAEKVRL